MLLNPNHQLNHKFISLSQKAYLLPPKICSTPSLPTTKKEMFSSLESICALNYLWNYHWKYNAIIKKYTTIKCDSVITKDFFISFCLTCNTKYIYYEIFHKNTMIKMIIKTLTWTTYITITSIQLPSTWVAHDSVSKNSQPWLTKSQSLWIDAQKEPNKSKKEISKERYTLIGIFFAAKRIFSDLNFWYFPQLDIIWVENFSYGESNKPVRNFYEIFYSQMDSHRVLKMFYRHCF